MDVLSFFSQVGGSKDFIDLVTMNRPPPSVQACASPDSITTNFAMSKKVTLSSAGSGAAAMATDGNS